MTIDDNWLEKLLNRDKHTTTIVCPSEEHYAHKDRHLLLHKYLDELIVDFLRHNRDKGLSNTTILELVVWSTKQMQKELE